MECPDWQPGDTFINKATRQFPSHLWFVVAVDAESICLVANATSDDMDEACILDTCDHPFFKHESVIRYRSASKTSRKALNEAYRTGQIVAQTPVTREVIERIRQGFSTSDFA